MSLVVLRFLSAILSYLVCSENAAGSTVDAMSDAIEGADVMLYGVSLRYKESANVRTPQRR